MLSRSVVSGAPEASETAGRAHRREVANVGEERQQVRRDPDRLELRLDDAADEL